VATAPRIDENEYEVGSMSKLRIAGGEGFYSFAHLSAVIGYG